MRILRIGSFGSDVKLLQQALGIYSDGWFGQDTYKAVIDFQKKKGLSPDGVVGFKTYEALDIIVIKAPEWLILHCSATPQHIAGLNAMAIANYHIHTLRWGRCGYARIVEYDGKIVETHKVDTTDGIQPFEMTYGTGNRSVDLQALNVCYVGGLNKDFKVADTRTDAQKNSMELLTKQIVMAHPSIKVGGHNQFFNKACPSFWVATWLEEIGIPEKNIYRADPFGYERLFKRKKVL